MYNIMHTDFLETLSVSKLHKIDQHLLHSPKHPGMGIRPAAKTSVPKPGKRRGTTRHLLIPSPRAGSKNGQQQMAPAASKIKNAALPKTPQKQFRIPTPIYSDDATAGSRAAREAHPSRTFFPAQRPSHRPSETQLAAGRPRERDSRATLRANDEREGRSRTRTER